MAEERSEFRILKGFSQTQKADAISLSNFVYPVTLHSMKTLVILSLSIATTFGGETIIPLKSGDTQEQQSPVIGVIKDAREFRSKNNEKIPKATSDEVLNVLNRFAGTFQPSDRDCRIPEQGPKAALEPAHVVSFTTSANENGFVELYVFSEKHSVLQISIGSKVKKFFLSTEKDLIGQFSKIMQEGIQR